MVLVQEQRYGFKPKTDRVLEIYVTERNQPQIDLCSVISSLTFNSIVPVFRDPLPPTDHPCLLVYLSRNSATNGSSASSAASFKIPYPRQTTLVHIWYTARSPTPNVHPTAPDTIPTASGGTFFIICCLLKEYLPPADRLCLFRKSNLQSVLFMLSAIIFGETQLFLHLKRFYICILTFRT